MSGAEVLKLVISWQEFEIRGIMVFLWVRESVKAR